VPQVLLGPLLAPAPRLRPLLLVPLPSSLSALSLLVSSLSSHKCLVIERLL